MPPGTNASNAHHEDIPTRRKMIQRGGYYRTTRAEVTSGITIHSCIPKGPKSTEFMPLFQQGQVEEARRFGR
jgi:hypothetical protein